MARTSVVLVLAALTALPVSPSFAAAEQKAKKPAPAPAAASGGTVRVDGKTVTLAHGYLFQAPDAFKASQRNSVVLLVPQPVDKAKLEAAKTFRDVLDLTKERVVVELPPEGSGSISICHESFGPGMCYSTGLAAFTWTPGVREDGHVSGRVQSFGGKEETVLETRKLLFDVTFDVRGQKSVAARR